MYCTTVGPISTLYFSVNVRSWNFDVNMTNIICKLHAKLNFVIFCYSLRWLKNLLTFSSEIFFVTMFLFLLWKKRKQITTPISTFRFLYNKTLLQCAILANKLSKLDKGTNFENELLWNKNGKHFLKSLKY